MTNNQVKKKRRPYRVYAFHSLQQALLISQAIQDKNNGRPFKRILLANAIKKSPSGTDFRDLLSSSFKYGLTLGTEKADSISLTELGQSIVKSRDATEKSKGLREAALKADLFRKIYERYDNGKLPQEQFLKNVLEVDFHVPPENREEVARLIKENGIFAGIIRDVSGSPYVMIEGEQVTPPEVEPTEVAEVAEGAEVPVSAEAPKAERKIFVGHGKNMKPVQQLEKVLQQFKIPYIVAEEEPNRGRPISVKVAELMRECSAAILVFTSDEEFKDLQGNTIWRPSENVIDERGAASILYGDRMVIFKEEGIDLPTNFRDIGYISFEKDRLNAKGLELIKELVALGFLRVTV